ncbi:MAG: DUF2007 domain-containing protein [Bacteroidota bacterium]
MEKLMDNWQKVYSTSDTLRAEIVKSTLEAHKIQAIILNKRDSSYNDFGQREIYVSQENHGAALTIIENEISFK